MLDQQLDNKIENAVNNNNSSTPPYEGFNSKPPFIPRIVQESLFLYFKLLEPKVYDETVDPIIHLETFKAAILLQGASDAIFCRVFPPTLKGAAWQWYSSLKSASIHSFEDIYRSFVCHFINSRRQQKQFDYLYNIKQKEDESIRTFMNRFNMTILKVCNLEQSTTMAVMMYGLLKKDLKKSLIKTYP
uniref:Uncharacterized protein LOC105058013 n=1 Tax=Elaeis guineensis var. tenera TaxID=51953 RepID=A0A6I9S7S8_ELAGV|nr:uncharacterized protein LOC105058013 [Elaeis guineensis]